MPRAEEVAALDRFLDSDEPRALLGLVYGRRRIGKSTLLVGRVEQRDGFYFEATRVETPVHLDRLGAALGGHLGVGRLAFDDWREAVEGLLRIGQQAQLPVVLDEFGHILEADPSVDSVLASAFGPGARRRRSSRVRMVLCGSAIAMMRALTEGQASLRGRVGVEIVMHPDDFRTAATRLADPDDYELAVRVFAVIGGVVGYATDMCNFDLPTSMDDFGRWVAERVLSPAAPLHYEATTLLAEDPSLAGSPLMHHAILGAIANGSVTAGRISRRVGRPVSNLAPALNRLVEAGFVVRHADPVRKRRPVYALSDPYLQFHYAILEPHRSSLRARAPLHVWREGLVATFNSRVRGPVFEEQARTWAARFADVATVGGSRDHVGPSTVSVQGEERELDVIVTDGEMEPSERTVTAIGEAKAGEQVGSAHLERLQQARSALSARASGAKLLLFASRFDRDLRAAAAERADVELIDLERLYTGS